MHSPATRRGGRRSTARHPPETSPVQDRNDQWAGGVQDEGSDTADSEAA